MLVIEIACILLDATIKLWQAKRIQEKYKNSISYELGTIISGIQDVFRHMLEEYKKYSNLTNFRLSKHYLETVVGGYQIIKHDYNQLHMEVDMYYNTLRKHAERQKKEIEDKKNKFFFDLKKKRPKRRNFEEEQYKRSLRHDMWAKKWDHFVPEIEGIDIEGFTPSD